MSTYSEFLEKSQSELLAGLKQMQELNVKALTSFSQLAATMPLPTTTDVKNVEIPSATEIVESTFAFTNQIVELRKEYMLKLADFAVNGQKQFTEVAQRVAQAAKN